VIDSDQHLYEPRTLWRDYADPSGRGLALSLVDDARGYTWLSWRGDRLELADVHQPGDVAWCGRHRERWRRGERSAYDYDELLPATYWDPAARVDWLDTVGVDEAVCFPNYGLLWERRLSGDLPSMLVNMTAWNRWCAEVRASSRGRLHPVAHVTLRDREWLVAQLRALAAADVRLAMVAPAPVDGRPLSHRDLAPAWAAFVEHGVTPVFHVADQPRVFDDCWYADETAFVPTLESVFLWVPAALAITDLILRGVLERHPDLRIGVVELSSIWVPQYLLMLDGGFDFTARLNGRPEVVLSRRPSEYFTGQVRVSSFSYEDPARLTRSAGDLFMCCSDFPHSEGTASPIDDYRAAGCDPAERPGLFDGNIGFLLRQ
jgi:predicted TIM-barrel fold metal-dependent hydrolase